MGSLYQARKSANPFNAVTPGNPGRPIVPLRTNESRCTDAFPHFPMIRKKSRLGIKATYHSVPDPDLEIGGGGGVFSALRASVWSETEVGGSPGFATAIYIAQPEFRMEIK